MENINVFNAQADWPAAVIAGSFQTGVLGVRSLQRKGVKAVCFDCNPNMHGFTSVYGPARLCPNPSDEPEAWVHFMKELAQEFMSKPVLISSADLFVSAIAKHRKELDEYYIISPGIEIQGLMAEKQTQYQLAIEHGMPMPVTGMIGSLEELKEFSKKLSYPCLIKPWYFREWEQFAKGHPLLFEKIVIVNNIEELIASYELAMEANPNVIVQDIIQGEDTSKRVYLACYNNKGERIANALFRELRCVPLGFGPASISEPVIDDEADKVCDSFLRSVGYKGICEIEVKRDSVDGKVKLIEVNPRLSGGGDAAPYAGVDLCWIHYLDLIGKSIEPVQPNQKNFKHIVLRSEGTAIPRYMKAGLLSWRDLFNSYKPPLAFFDFDIRDWKMSLHTLYILFKDLVIESFKKK